MGTIKRFEDIKAWQSARENGFIATLTKDKKRHKIKEDSDFLGYSDQND